MIINGIDSTTFGSAALGATGNPKKLAAFYDPRDSNHDGSVSVAEAFQYSLSHPPVDIFNALPALKSETADAAASTLFAPLKARSNPYDVTVRISEPGQVTDLAVKPATSAAAPNALFSPLGAAASPYDSQGNFTQASQGSRLDIIA